MVVEAVAIDGPAGSGKTTVGRTAAKRLDFGFLDTGLMYRAATWWAIRLGVDLQDDRVLTRMIQTVRIELTISHAGDRLLVDGTDATDELRSPEIDRNVSAVSAVSGVRRALVPQQRRIAEQGPIVMVGRDIGTVVLADARIKVFLNASVATRARRRYSEMLRSGMKVDLGQVMDETSLRDRIDSERLDSPLRVADDAVVVRTDDLTVEQVVARIVNLVGGG